MCPLPRRGGIWKGLSIRRRVITRLVRLGTRRFSVCGNSSFSQSHPYSQPHLYTYPGHRAGRPLRGALNSILPPRVHPTGCSSVCAAVQLAVPLSPLFSLSLSLLPLRWVTLFPHSPISFTNDGLSAPHPMVHALPPVPPITAQQASNASSSSSPPPPPLVYATTRPTVATMAPSSLGRDGTPGSGRGAARPTSTGARAGTWGSHRRSRSGSCPRTGSSCLSSESERSNWGVREYSD